jgi:hypothetical protein
LFSKEESIESMSMLFAVVDGLSFENKMKCFARCARFFINDITNQKYKRVFMVISDCLVCNFILDITNYLHGKMKVIDARNRSICVKALMNDLSLRGLLDDALQRMARHYEN